MLRLTEEQLAQMDRLEIQQYLAEICDKILAEVPELASDHNLDARLARAYRHAVTIGFEDGSALIQFQYLEACAPGFYTQPAIHAWLTKLGKPIEQRFADLNALLKSKLRGM